MVGLNNQNISLNNNAIEHIFSGDSYGLFVFKKIEKISTAIYILTSLMSDTEPMRLRVRELTDDLIQNSLLMSERVWGEDYLQKNIVNSLSEISILFNLAETTKMISKMNHDILSIEIQKMIDFMVTSNKNYSSAKIAFPQNIFSGDYNYIPDNGYKNDNQNNIKYNSQNSGFDYKGQKDINKDTVLNKMSDIKINDREKNIKDKNNRQDIIKDMLKSGVKLTIKDFAQNIKGCSEKTIQRELIVMLNSGVLKKEGERRWSKYFLA